MTIVLAAENFVKGYASDIARDQLPAGYAYRMKDWIPGLDARLRGRGGWAYTSPALSSIHAGPTSIAAVAWAPFLGDEHMLAIGNDGSSYLDRNLDGVTASFVSSGSTPSTTPPFWHKDLVTALASSGGIIIPCSYKAPSGQAVQKYAPTVSAYVVAALGGSPPAATTGVSWGDYLILANGDATNTHSGSPSAHPNRIWISGVGNPESWTPGTNFWDSVIPDIVAMVTVRSGILVFGFRETALISGDTPPAGGNWSEQIIFAGQGCFDVRSVAKYEDDVFFANSTGVYSTDGVTLTDVTLACGVKNRWKQLVDGFNGIAGWTAAAGIYRNYYVIVVHDNSGNFVTCHVFDFANHVAFEFTNIRAQMFAHVASNKGNALAAYGEERLLAATFTDTHVHSLRECWTAPDAMVDADGSNVLPVLETPFWKLGGPGRKVFRSARSTYDVRTNGGSTPSFSVDYALTPSGSYVNAGSLPTTTDETRARVDIRNRGTGIGLRLTQVGKSGHTSLSEIELDQSVLEGMR